MNLVVRLLSKNISLGRLTGFILSNFIGLAIVVGAIFFYEDAGSLWENDDSFITRDYLVVNKKIGGSDVWDSSLSSFSDNEIADISQQPWVRKVGRFSANDYRVWAEVSATGRGMSTMLFFESVPDSFVDGVDDNWTFEPGQQYVPVVISKDYLALYNFGFAGSVGLPKMSENLMSGIPLKLTLSSDDGSRTANLNARIVGYSNRLNTILVPEAFMQWSNELLGDKKGDIKPSRLIIEVSSPGDVAIQDYLDAHNLEVAGDKTSSSAAYFLKVITGIILSIGIIITLLSFFVLLLSMSLLMEKNRDKIHSLLMLGYPLRSVEFPYMGIVAVASVVAFGLASLCCLLLRGGYLDALTSLGATPGRVWVGLHAGALITLCIMIINCLSIHRRTVRSWRL